MILRPYSNSNYFKTNKKDLPVLPKVYLQTNRELPLISLLMFYATFSVETLDMDVCTHRDNVNCVHHVPVVYMFSLVFCVCFMFVCVNYSLLPSMFFSSGLYIPTLLLSSGAGGELSNCRVFCFD